MRSSMLSAEQPGQIAERLFGPRRRVLVFGEMGVGKSTLVMELARWLGRSGADHLVIGADPGRPAFGVPGAVCQGRWRGDGFHLLDYEALCSLNAGRFRLPLVQAVQRLIISLEVPLLLIDAPGVTRGVAGAELLTGLVETAAADTVLLVAREGKPAPMMHELNAMGVDICRITASSQARPPNSRRRMRERTRLWDTHLAGMPEIRLPLKALHLVGTPPPIASAEQWRGRQIALLEKDRTVAMGEVLAAENNYLTVRLPVITSAAKQLLVRDAARKENGGLGTVAPIRIGPSRSLFPPDCLPDTDRPTGPKPVAKLRRMTAVLVNGILGAPLLHLRLHNQKRSLLFDLGEGSRLPARIAHQVSDVFISHAHIDHISGFLWLLRSRIGELPVCRIFGPPGLSRHIAGMIAGIHWDRIGIRGPGFDVFECHGDRLEGFRLQAGTRGLEPLGQRQAAGGLLVNDPAFSVRAITLDHGIPVLALAFEQKPEPIVSRDALRELGYPPGPWVGALKHRVAQGKREGEVALPGGRKVPLGILADELIRIMPGEKLVYATDVADTPANRKKLIGLARGSHTFFCEAAFLAAHQKLAVSTGHLTARACGEIAAAAGVRRLAPFHLSKRYGHKIGQVLDEAREACPGVDVARTL